MKIKDIVKKIDEVLGTPASDSNGREIPSNGVRVIKWNVTDPDMKLVEEIWEGGRRAFITPKGNPTANLRRLVFGHPNTVNSNVSHEFVVEPVVISWGNAYPIDKKEK